MTLQKRILAVLAAIAIAFSISAVGASAANAWPPCNSTTVATAASSPGYAAAKGSCSNGAQAQLNYRSPAGTAYTSYGPGTQVPYWSITGTVTNNWITLRTGIPLWFT